MFLISLLLTGLVAIAVITELNSTPTESAELLPIPVRVSQVRDSKKHY